MKDELCSLAIPRDVQSEILSDIFGERIDSMHLTGLVDAKSEKDFEMSLATLAQKWKLHDLEETSGRYHDFVTGFIPTKQNCSKKT